MPRPELVKLLDKMVRGPSGTRDVPCLLYIARKGYLSRDEIKVRYSTGPARMIHHYQLHTHTPLCPAV